MENNLGFNSPPILLIMFNRPHRAAQVFEKIRQVRPSKMFMVVDGARPNRPGEAEKVQQCRAFKDLVDWECDLKVDFAETNMGCKDRVASGITWAFKHVDELIILEDDCVPDLSFFRFCREMLDKYRDDNRVFTIAGSNQDYTEPFEESYGFSKRMYCWGWATWKRAWKVFDVTMRHWPKLQQDKYLKNIFRKHDRFYLENEFQKTYEEKINSWAYRYWINCLVNHALHIIPKVNMVRNIGFESGGTHTNFPKISHLYMDEPIDFPLTHPEIMSPMDRLFVPPTEPENQRDKIEFYKECERTLAEYDATFRQLLNYKQFYAVIMLFKDVLRKRITPQLTEYHLNFIHYTALAYLNLGDYEHAEALTEILLTFNPNNIDLLLFQTNLSLNRRNFRKAYELVMRLKSLNVANDEQRVQINDLAAVLESLNSGGTNK